MPASSRDELPLTTDMGDMYQGRTAEWGEMTIAFEKYSAGDPAALYKGLPDDRCQCPHWGFLFKGKLVIRYADREETIEAGQAYYMAPGHLPLALEACEGVEYSPTAELQKTAEAVGRNLAAMQEAG